MYIIYEALIGILTFSSQKEKPLDRYYDSDAGTGGARGATGPPNIWQIR